MDRIRKMIHATDTQGLTGAGVYVAVLDSGISLHPDFEDRIVEFKDFTSTNKRGVRPFDDHGHGTHVSCIKVSLEKVG